jgi:PIN domain nuclease of toxin-antitoxin system
MNYLIDTNIFIFLIEKSVHRFSSAQKEILKNPNNTLFLSEASLYEMAIKARLEKPNFSHINIKTIDAERKENGIKLLKSRIEYYTNIPQVPKAIDSKGKVHGDPFDLLIISQALVENLQILSTDSLFPEYQGLKVIS